MDPKPEKGINPYVVFADNPILNTDPFGDTTRLSFDGKTGKITIYGNTAENPRYVKVGSYDAHNRTDRSSQGKWEDGNYPMQDKNTPTMHGEDVDKKGIKKDSRGGAYGVYGDYVAKSFTQTDGKFRSGMAIYAGRAKTVDQVGGVTMGCIRVGESTMEEIADAIDKYGSLESITILNNKSRQDNAKIHEPFLNKTLNIFAPKIRRTTPADNTLLQRIVYPETIKPILK